jgi:hypothetical protein
VNTRPELADDDITRPHGFTAKHFNTAPLSFAVAPVTGTPASFFMCHIRSYFLTINSGDLESGLVLPMTSLATVTLASLLLKNQDLLRSGLTDNLAGYGGILHQRRADFRLTIAADKQDISQRYLFANVSNKLLDLDEIPFRYSVLLPASFNDCIFHDFPNAFF